jgi:hypothetical protein
MQKNVRPNESVAEPKSQIAIHLERIAKILALSAIRTQKRDEQVAFLHSVDYAPAEIATLLDTSANTVSVALYQRKRKQASPKRPKK